MAARDIRPAELEKFTELMGYFRDSGCRLYLPQYSRTNLLVECVSGHLGIASADDAVKLGFHISKSLALEDFPFPEIKRFPFEHRNLGGTHIFLTGPKTGNQTYIIFPNSSDLESQGMFMGREHIIVPNQAVRKAGLLYSDS